MTILFGLFGAVYIFGSATTRDEFIRELLFQGITHTPWLQLFFVGLIAVAIVLAVKAQKRGRSLESSEMQRLADQKTELQEQLAGKLLSHSAPPPEGKSEL